MELKSELVSRKVAAVYIGVCLTTLDRLDIPKTRIRHRVMYRTAFLEKWIDENTGKTKRGKKS
jgi:hypothetical protein